MRFYPCMTLCLVGISASVVADPAVQSPVATLAGQTHVTPSFYINSRLSSAQQAPEAQLNAGGHEQWQVNGGYQYQMGSQVALYMEAGVGAVAEQEENRAKYNLTTGVSYQPISSLELKSQLRGESAGKREDAEGNANLEFIGTYQLGNKIGVEASYNADLTQQQMQVGLSYRF